MFFDTHAHYDQNLFDTDRTSILASLPLRGIGLVLNPGISLKTSRAAVNLAAHYPYLYSAVGVHPKETVGLNGNWLEELRKLASADKVVAIGEIGLDYYWEKLASREIQKAAFRAQLNLAQEMDMPVIIHDREAHEDIVSVIREFPELRGEFHCFSGDVRLAQELVDRGWYLGFDSPVTFQQNQDHARKVIQAVPLERMLLETDAPFLTPVPHRKKRNDSTYLPLVAEKIAEWKGITAEDVEVVTWENGKRFFGID